jgi:tRNA/tmRNA/rRNA uracil-C5-methylase (TrmA/RlmC/RlmD family)
MEKRRWYNNFYVVIALAGVLLMGAQTVFITAAYADESIEVECYIKVNDDYVSVSNVDVFDASKAAATCNSIFMDCKGQCIGCYLDENGDEYCYDTAGRKFQR